jgi:hypothetical protein
MNIAKNMEAIFFVAIAVIGISNFASAAVPAHHHAVTPRVAAAAQAENTVAVVTITGKRLSAAQKAQFAN